MISFIRASSRSMVPAVVLLSCLSLGLLLTSAARSQAARTAPASKPRKTSSTQAEKGTFPALLVSDIHFDPFHDPAKTKQLAAASVAQWRSILAAPPSANQQQAFSDLQRTCHARGVDTPYSLFHSSVAAMHSRQPDAKFMTVSGDLIAHAFTCRYASVFPDAAPGDYQAFVLKTLSFVVEELRAGFPGMPVYVSLGNNDSGCGDYQLDPGSDFLAQAGNIIAEGLPPSQRQQAIKQSAAGGYYSVTMAEPMHNTRLIVINDLFLSPKYNTCGGKKDATGATEQLTWFERQLQDAEKSGQRIWIMGHIPPGIDPFSTVSKFKNVCGGESPVLFLASDKLADLMVEHADVIRLAIFAHTHMDEMRLLESDDHAPQASEVHRVAVKLVPSISPVDGNNPSFTVARVNLSTANLENYEVIAASNQTGVDTKWSTEYNFAATYHQAEFSPATVSKLINEFRADHIAITAPSQAYIRDYFVGDMSGALTPFWPEYLCAVDNHTAKGFASCVCATPQ